ncbi:cation:proton antiporter [Thermostichus vulcanus]|uniref:Cation:proton antiporter n=1 Tax=Thermostichus vulcanus str. 'Rupite' TaxID=2813851 RepID=A0ABT0CCI0_THEVL|nr:cation:proton antiporter [Thermostichus vulcanus]MCJ2543496.1 cation:proton antiporter [Thermostichus vulcanus str. 'Rupite']
METLVLVLQEEPILSFALLLGVILVVPLLFEWLRLPGLVGLLAAGIALGPQGLNLLTAELPTVQLLSDIGVVYLLFVAGLEIDLEQFRQTRNRSATFGFFTFAIPLLVGTLIGRFFGFGWNSAVLLGSLFASHTPLGYPIVSRYGLVKNEAVLVTIGGTIFTDIASLLVLAVCVGIHGGEFTIWSLLGLLGSLLIYAAAVLFGLDWLGHRFFRRTGSEEGNQFLFVLLALFVAALGAQWIGVEKIIGAFLAGLAVNDVLREGPVKEKIVFVGSVLFIPVFFVDMGLLIDLPAFVQTLSSIWLMLAILVGLSFSKYSAAQLCQWLYHYTPAQKLMMWSLSLPQVAATLAATAVGFQVGLLNASVLNSVIVLMLVTATLGPILTSRAGAQMAMQEEQAQLTPPVDPAQEKPRPPQDSYVVVVPVANPETEQNLLEMAALLAKHEQGRIVPLSVATGHVHMDAPSLQASLEHGEYLLKRAVEFCQQFEVQVTPLSRIDSHIAQGISHASREQKASLIVMGWSDTTGLRARLFGNVINSVLWATHCPVAVARLQHPPHKLQRILVALENFRSQSARSVRLAQILATANQAEITLLHVCPSGTSEPDRHWLEAQLTALAEQPSPASGSRLEVKVLVSDDIVKTLLKEAEGFDLVVLPSFRRRNRSGGLSFSDVTTEVLERLNSSLVMLGEPLELGQ